MTVRELILELGSKLTDEQLDLPVIVGDCCPRDLDYVELQGDVVFFGSAG